MNKVNFILGFCIVPLLSLVFSTSIFASDLVNSQWLKDHSQNVKIIDLRAANMFQTGRIPHAINIPYSQFTRKKNEIDGFVETPTAFKALMENHGITNSDMLVLYGDWSFLDSMRVYWIMDFYGHKQIKVLDGGFQAWQERIGELSFDVEPIKKSQYTIEINTHIMTTKFRTFMASSNPDYVLIDGRDKNQFQGETSLTSRKGHIPNAINIPWVNLVKNRNGNDGYDRISGPSTLHDINTLKEKLSLIPKDKKIILYCNGGKESSVLYFALKELGINAAVYDGSWFEWSADYKMPITKTSVQ